MLAGLIIYKVKIIEKQNIKSSNLTRVVIVVTCWLSKETTSHSTKILFVVYIGSVLIKHTHTACTLTNKQINKQTDEHPLMRGGKKRKTLDFGP